MMGATRRATLVLLLVLGGCLGTETGNPPFKPEADPSGIAYKPTVTIGTVRFEAESGTIDPAEGEIVVTNLDGESDLARAPVRADGGFTISVGGTNEDAYRFEVVARDRRSSPVDLTGADALGPVERPLSECLAIEPGLQLGFGPDKPERTITVRNDCEDELTFDAPRLRRSTDAFEIVDDTSFSLQPGDDRSVAVRSTGSARIQEILFVRVNEPRSSRWPVTLYRDGSDG